MAKVEIPQYADVQSYNEVLKRVNNRPKHLLLGNGFSMSYDNKIFSYNALSKFIHEIKNKQLQQLFNIVNTNNFELLMQQLDNAAQIAMIFGADEKVVNKIKEGSEILKTSLIDAIKELHPDHVFTIPAERSQACANFLNSFLSQGGEVFTTNYDLLLYWVCERNQLIKRCDGFGRNAEDTDEWIKPEDRRYSELRWGKNKEDQSIYYLHGALQIFDIGIEIIKEEYTSEHLLLDNIKKRMAEKEYPIFVTAGNGDEKLTHIMHNKYLSYGYEALMAIEGSLIVYGFSFSSYDDHIIRAINKAGKPRKDKNDIWHKLQSVYVGLYSEDDYNHIKNIEKQFKVPLRVFDAKTLNVWG
jgi:hypothetical protein